MPVAESQVRLTAADRTVLHVAWHAAPNQLIIPYRGPDKRQVRRCSLVANSEHTVLESDLATMAASEALQQAS